MHRLIPTRGRIAACDLPAREHALIETARTIFLEHGYERATVESIARGAHVSPKTIYARYGGKSGMFLAAMKPAVLDLTAPLEADVTDAAALEGALALFGERLLALTLSPAALRLQRMMLGDGHRFPDLVRAFYESGPARGLAAVGAVLARAHAAGAIDCEDPSEAADFFLGALQGDVSRRALLFTDVPSPRALRLRARRCARTFVRALTTGAQGAG